MATCSLRCLQWEELKEQPESCSRILTTAVICIQVRPARSPQKKKKICTRGDFRPSLRACVRSAELIYGNTPRRKVCFTTFAPRGAAEMRRGPPRARHLIWSDWEEWPRVPNCFPPPRDEKGRKWREGEKKQRKGACLEYIEDDQWRLDLQSKIFWYYTGI